MLYLEENPVTDEKPTGKKRKGMLGFYIGMGAVAFLLVGAWFAWTPLKLRYAIYKVRKDGPAIRMCDVDPSGCPFDVGMATPWMLVCADAACRGSEPAMELLLENPRVRLSEGGGALADRYENPEEISIIYPAAEDQPRLLFKVLENHSDAEVLRVLMAISDSAASDEELTITVPSVERLTDAKSVIDELELFVPARNGPVERVAAAALEFARRRFAKELAEAEKQKVKGAK